MPFSTQKGHIWVYDNFKTNQQISVKDCLIDWLIDWLYLVLFSTEKRYKLQVPL